MEIVSIPLPALKRLRHYIRIVREYDEDGQSWVSTTDIGRLLGLKSIQVRKDLAYTGVEGQPKKGYPVRALRETLSNYLGENNYADVFLVGASPMARALLEDEGIKRHGFSLVAVFDDDPGLAATGFCGRDVFPLEKLENLIGRMSIRLAILCVPPAAAQGVADRLARAGIRGIWNFSGRSVEHPASVNVLQEDFGARLSSLARDMVH